jgi:hypothetical protein
MCKYSSSIILSCRQVIVYLFLIFFRFQKFVSRLFELVVRHLDLDSLLEFFEQIRLLTETPLSKRTSDISPSLPQNLFPMHIVIERIGDMTLGIIASLRPRYHVCKVWSCVSQLFIQVI